MQVFRDLYLRCDAERLTATLAEIERSLTAGWSRDRGSETRMRSTSVDNRPVFCFACTKEGLRPAATIFLLEKSPNLYWAANVVPTSTRQLSVGEYNGILQEFYERFVRAAAQRTGATAELTASDAELEHWLSPEAAAKLRWFSTSANRGTGSSHPADKERWHDFVLTAHEKGDQLDASTLERWLIEMEGWAPEIADALALEYELGRKLLAFADGHRRSA